MPITMSDEDFLNYQKETMKLAVREAIKAVNEEYSRGSVRKREIKTIKEKLSNYRRHKKTLQEDADFTEFEKNEYRLQFLEDLMGAKTLDSDRTENILLAREEKRRAIRFELMLIDGAVEKFREEVEASFDMERERWFNVMYDFYIADEQKSMDDIADTYHVCTRTAFRDLDKAAGVILAYIV